VLVTALRSELGVSGDHDGLLVADIRHPDAVESLLGSIHRGGGLPLVTCRADDLQAVRRLVTFASVRFPGLHACVEPLPGTPLCVGVISSLVDDIDADASTTPDNVLAWRLSALDLLREQVWSAVWLPSVAKMTQPAPGLYNHVRSWLPGSGFLAVHSPTREVSRARRARVSGVQERPGHALIHSPSRSAWVVDAVSDALGPVSVSELSTVRAQIDSFGTPDATELVAVPLSFHTQSRPRSAGIATCQACGIRHARPACPVCQMAASTDQSLVSPGVPS